MTTDQNMFNIFYTLNVVKSMIKCSLFTLKNFNKLSCENIDRSKVIILNVITE